MEILAKNYWYKIFKEGNQFFIECDCGEAVSTGWSLYEISEDQAFRSQRSDKDVELVILEIQNKLADVD